MSNLKMILLVGFLSSLLGACSSALLVPVQYTNSVIVTSDLPANLILNTGEAAGYSTTTMIFAGGVFVPVSSGPTPNLHFGETDQLVFMQSLSDELLRHNIVSDVYESDAKDVLQVYLDFVTTEHLPNLQEYRILAALILSYDDVTVDRKFDVLSSEGDSIWVQMGTNAASGKEKAAKKLMDRVIPNIERFVGLVKRELHYE